MLAALADVTVKISRRVTRHSPRGKRGMPTTQSHFTDSGFCCLVFLYFAVLALLVFGLVDSLSWELLFAYNMLSIP